MDLLPRETGLFHQGIGVLPRIVGLLPREKGFLPQSIHVVPQIMGLLPLPRGFLPRIMGLLPRITGLLPRCFGWDRIIKARGIVKNTSLLPHIWAYCPAEKRAYCPTYKLIAPDFGLIAPEYGLIAPEYGLIAPCVAISANPRPRAQACWPHGFMRHQ